MRRLTVLIGVVLVAALVTAGLVLGLQALTARRQRAAPVEQPRQELDVPETPKGCDGPGPNCGDPPITDVMPPEKYPIPDPPYDLPESRPYVDPDGRTGTFWHLLPPGPPPSEIGQCDSGPTQIIFVPPQYPRRESPVGHEGDVTLEFTVTRRGQVEGARVVESTDQFFDQAALDAVSQWRYEPCIRNGSPVDLPGVRVTLSFRLDDGEEKN